MEVETRKSLSRLLRPLRRPIKAINGLLSAARLRARKAAAARQLARHCGSYVAITGSCGKSTTALLAGRLLRRGSTVTVLRTHNFGRHLLKPLCALSGPVDFIVQEVSADSPGALTVITDTLPLAAAVVTTVGDDHGSAYRGSGLPVREAIAREKGRLVEAVGQGGFVCLNADDPLVLAMAGRTRARIVTFGRAEGAELRAVNVDASWPGRLRFDLEVGGRTYPVATRFFGTLMLTSVLAALALTHGFRRDLAAAIADLASVEPAEEHMSLHRGVGGSTLVLDTFKAPLWSTRLLVEDFESLGTRQFTFVLGNMSDMLNDRGRRYRGVLREAAARVDAVIATGDAARYAEAVRAEGFGNITILETPAEVSRELATRGPGLVVLKSNTDLQLAQALQLAVPLRFEGAGD